MIELKPRIKITLIDRKGSHLCHRGHQIGDSFYYDTERGKLCPMAMHVAFPYIDILRYGGEPAKAECGEIRFCCPDSDVINVFRIYDDFYDGVLDEQDDSVSYSDWSKARSNEYKLWSDTRSDCYKQWSNMRSDVYGFWSDMRSEMYSDDIERAQKIFDDFMKDVQKMLEP